MKVYNHFITSNILKTKNSFIRAVPVYDQGTD